MAELGPALSELSVPLPAATWERARAVLVASGLLPEGGPVRFEDEKGPSTWPGERNLDGVLESERAPDSIADEGVGAGGPDISEAAIRPELEARLAQRIMRANVVSGAVVLKWNVGGEAEKERPGVPVDLTDRSGEEGAQEVQVCGCGSNGIDSPGGFHGDQSPVADCPQCRQRRSERHPSGAEPHVLLPPALRFLPRLR